VELVARQGYQRVLKIAVGGTPEFLRLDEVKETSQLIVVQDRIALLGKNRARFTEACEQAYHFGKGRLTIYFSGETKRCQYSNRLHCAECDIEYR
jgi:excinuclease UvrABC ATPase subunit